MTQCGNQYVSRRLSPYYLVCCLSLSSFPRLSLSLSLCTSFTSSLSRYSFFLSILVLRRPFFSFSVHILVLRHPRLLSLSSIFLLSLFYHISSRSCNYLVSNIVLVLSHPSSCHVHCAPRPLALPPISLNIQRLLLISLSQPHDRYEY